MKKVLGLDLGTNSIGWAVVDEENQQIVDTGVRIFPEGVDAIGMGEKEQSKNATRREFRQKRRQTFRRRVRRIKLLETLIEQGMCPLTSEELATWKHWDKYRKTEGRQFPDTSDFRGWLKMNPYALRDKALKEQLSLYEFGRILYHIIHHRGFLSGRKEKDTGKLYSGKEGITGIEKTREQIGDSTLGTMLNAMLPREKEPFRYLKDEEGNELRVRGRYTLRDMYIEEFERIWNRQAEKLGLTECVVKTQKVRFIEGTAEREENRKKLVYLRKKLGDENVIVEGKKVITIEPVSLKVFLAGEIWFEEGRVRHRSQNSLLFWQRPLRSQKALLNKCTFESREWKANGNGRTIIIGKSPCAVSHPDFEKYRALKFINNIEFGSYRKDRLKTQLDEEQRGVLWELFQTKKQLFNFSEIPKKLQLTFEQFNYSDDEKVSGCTTIAQIKKLFDTSVWGESYHDIWHCFHFYTDNQMLFDKLVRDYGLKLESAEDLKKVSLKDDYSNISLKAIHNILPFLQKGYKEATAVVLGGVKNAFGERWDYFKESHDEIEREIIKILRSDNREGEAIEKIKAYLSEPFNQFGFTENDKAFKKLYHHSQAIEKKEVTDKLDEIENLRNPIVQQGLNELRRLVNQLLKKHGRFFQVKVELGRNLKQGKTKRREATLRINENLRKNEEARERLAEYGLAPSRENIHKYLLYREIEIKNGPVVCPYTGKAIGVTDLLGEENKFQIEHIIPRSVSLDDSFGNKTLCDARFNGLKGDRTPYEFYQINSDPVLWGGATSWEEIEQRAFRLLPYRKAKRFTSRKTFEKSSFIERQLNDTRYISKKAAEILSQICNDVRVMPGEMTAELRHLWGLNTILQPPYKIDTLQYETDEERKFPHWAVLGNEGVVKRVIPMQNKRPTVSKNQLVLPGEVKKEHFNARYLKLDIPATGLKDGRYWAVVGVTNHATFSPVYYPKPAVREGEIILSGHIRKGKFEHDALASQKIPVDGQPDGRYWVKLSITRHEWEEPQRKSKPKRNADQIQLFGEVTNGVFKSYIYQCETNEPDGKYWVKLDVDLNSAKVYETKSPEPSANGSQLVIQGMINDDQIFSPSVDPDYQVKAPLAPGKYWGIFELASMPADLHPVDVELPKTEKDETLLEGAIWLDKQTGEIRFDPKKNRDDHRHHAIDAITVALTRQGYLQKLSTFKGNDDERKRGNEAERPYFEEPWPGFQQDVAQAAEQILISHRKSNPVLTRISKRIRKNGQTHASVGYSVKGQLHNQYVYGRRTAADGRDAYHFRKPVTFLTNNKRLAKVVDPQIKALLLKHLKEDLGIDTSGTYKIPEDAFMKDGKPQVFLPNRRGEPVPVKKVRMRQSFSNAMQLKQSTGMNQYVDPQNNHHVLIYRDENGDLHESVVTLWEAVERKRQGQPVYQLPSTEKEEKTPVEIVDILEQNDMFILGLQDEEVLENMTDTKLISQHLYRLEAVSSKYYEFRHHLESTQKRNSFPHYLIISSLGSGIKGWLTFNPIKVKITQTGKIKPVR